MPAKFVKSYLEGEKRAIIIFVVNFFGAELVTFCRPNTTIEKDFYSIWQRQAHLMRGEVLEYHRGLEYSLS